jgi:hypothetical protein
VQGIDALSCRQLGQELKTCPVSGEAFIANIPLEMQNVLLIIGSSTIDMDEYTYTISKVFNSITTIRLD